MTEKRKTVINWTVIATALGTAVGSAVYSYTNAGGQDKIATKIAQELLAYHQWRDNATKDIEELQKQQSVLRERAAALEAVVRSRHGHRHPVIDPEPEPDPKPIRSKRKVEIPPDLVQQYKVDMFK